VVLAVVVVELLLEQLAVQELQGKGLQGEMGDILLQEIDLLVAVAVLQLLELQGHLHNLVMVVQEHQVQLQVHQLLMQVEAVVLEIVQLMQMVKVDLIQLK
jgi:hypothetical protein